MTQQPKRELFVHEDDWGQIEILPAAVADWCAGEIARIEEFAARHAAPDGAGWTDIYVRQAAPARLTDLAMPFAHTAAALAERLAEFDTVMSGTFSSPDAVARVRAFGPAHTTGVVLVPDSAAEHVEMITLVLNGSSDDTAMLISALAALPSAKLMLLADWPRGCLVSLTDKAQLETYLQALA